MEHHSTDEDRRRAFLTYLLLESDDETHELVTQVGHDAARHAADDAVVLACRENGTTTADLIVGRFKHRLQELLAASRRTH